MAVQGIKASFSERIGSAETRAFMRLVLAEPALQARLGECETPDEYLSAALAVAREHGILLEAGALADAIRPNLLGISRWEEAPVTLDHWPSPGWLPARTISDPAGPAIDWAWFGERELSEPFYEDSVRRASSLPFSQMFRTRTSLEALVAGLRDQPAPDPAGFIFHMSRCGSTLLARMLMAVPGHVVASEPEPLDAVVQWSTLGNSPLSTRIAALCAVVAALGRRDGERRQFFVKLDGWHILAQPLFREAFPNVPWVFLYRDPVEVMVSQMTLPGILAVPGLMSAQIFGIADGEAMPQTEYCARVLGRVCGAAEQYLALGGGLPVNYSELPRAATDRIPAHFGLRLSEVALATMQSVAVDQAKRPGHAFAPDGTMKREAASEELWAAVNTHLRPVYKRLELLRGQDSGSASRSACQT
jgi:hypothetical protein